VRTPPVDLTTDQLVQAMSEHWGLEAAASTYVPLGFGSHHWEVVADDERWFLTVDDLDLKHRTRSDTTGDARRRLQAALTTARELADNGLSFVVAPLPTAGCDVLVDVADHFVAALYPYVNGEPRHWDDYRTSTERLEVLERVVELHDASNAHAQVDDLAIASLDELDLAIEELGQPWTAGPYGDQARRLLDEHAAPLLRLIESYQRLARQVRAHADRFVVTHGEPHPGNTLVTDRGIVLIDWDTLLIAPPERDLWIVAGHDDQVAAAYTASNGVPVDPAAMACYRLRWDLDEIAGYITLFRRAHTDSADTAESWRNLRHFLQPQGRWPEHC
jgi:aminoglycoside phosphotransferase (APT) family kinase protein